MSMVPLVRGGLHAWPSMCCPRNDSSREAEDLGQSSAPATHGGNLGSALYRYLVSCNTAGNSPTFAKREGSHRRGDTSGELRVCGLTMVEHTGSAQAFPLPYAMSCYGGAWREPLLAEKTAGNRGKELGKYRFTLRDKHLFPNVLSKPNIPKKAYQLPIFPSNILTRKFAPLQQSFRCPGWTDLCTYIYHSDVRNG